LASSLPETRRGRPTGISGGAAFLAASLAVVVAVAVVGRGSPRLGFYLAGISGLTSFAAFSIVLSAPAIGSRLRLIGLGGSFALDSLPTRRKHRPGAGTRNLSV
jgi:hypothetical protein